MGGVSVGVNVATIVGVGEGGIFEGVIVGVIDGEGVIVGVGVDVALGVALGGTYTFVGIFFITVGVFSGSFVGDGLSDGEGIIVGNSFLTSFVMPKPKSGPIVIMAIKNENIKKEVIANSRLYV